MIMARDVFFIMEDKEVLPKCQKVLRKFLKETRLISTFGVPYSIFDILFTEYWIVSIE